MFNTFDLPETLARLEDARLSLTLPETLADLPSLPEPPPVWDGAGGEDRYAFDAPLPC